MPVNAPLIVLFAVFTEVADVQSVPVGVSLREERVVGTQELVPGVVGDRVDVERKKSSSESNLYTGRWRVNA